jgi:hypothetical protein
VNPLELLDSVTTPDGKALTLHRRSGIYLIKIDGHDLMSSRAHGSEEALARLACQELGVRGPGTVLRSCGSRREPSKIVDPSPGSPSPGSPGSARVLVGGLGMGFTLRATLDRLPADASVWVAEVFGEVIRWNREHLGQVAGHPLRDPRVRVERADVRDLLRPAAFGLVLLDVDNGPDALTLETNRQLYNGPGLARLREALVPGGVLGVWSASEDRRFLRRLRRAGFCCRHETVRARSQSKGARHTIFIARR